MALIFWKHKDPPSDPTKSEVPVSEQDGLPVGVYFRPTDAQDAEEVSGVNPFPTRDPRLVRGRPPVAQVVVSTSTVTLIAAANRARKQIKITNVTGTQIVNIGTALALLTSNGDYLAAPAGSNVVYDCTEAIYGLATTAAQTVAIFETEYVL